MRALSIVAALALAAPAPALAQSLDIPEGGYIVSDDVSLLPDAVQQKREELLAIAGTGDISALTPILETDRTTVSFGEPEGRTAHLVAESMDGEGIETLAILADILAAPYAAMDGGDGDPIYVWPYLAAFESLSDLSPDQLVDAYRIMAYAEFEEMKALDAWYFWRVYIGPDGTLQAFVAGD
jgi:hypothetical protein